MKDFIGEEIELGDELYVIKPINGKLSDDKTYICEGMDETTQIIKVLDDTGQQESYQAFRFYVSMVGRMFRDVKDAATVNETQTGEA